jgi:hypothetical protein
MKKSKNTDYFDDLKTGLEDALAWAHGKHSTVTLRDVELPEPPRPIRLRSLSK